MKDYIKESEWQLDNKAYYREVSHNSTAAHKKLIYQTLKRFKKQRLLKKEA